MDDNRSRIDLLLDARDHHRIRDERDCGKLQIGDGERVGDLRQDRIRDGQGEDGAKERENGADGMEDESLGLGWFQEGTGRVPHDEREWDPIPDLGSIAFISAARMYLSAQLSKGQ